MEREIIETWIKAFNVGDVDGLVELYAPDAINFQIAAGSPAVGVEKIKEDFIQFFHAFPNSYAKVVNIMVDGEWAAWEWDGGGTFTGKFLGEEPTGKSYNLRGCGFFQIRNKKIIFQRGYWDKQTWFSQIGLKSD